MNDLFSLEGKVAIVTGGNGGIGKAIARGFAMMGADIAIAARNACKTAEVVREIHEEFGTRTLGLQVDVRQPDQIQAMASQVLDTLRRIDILVNNAGIIIRNKPQNYTVAEWDEVIEINLRSVFLCSQAVYPAMTEVRGGKIINIASVLGSVFGGSWQASYVASKAGVVGLTRSLAVAWAPDDIQVNAILAGWIDTEMTVKARQHVPGLHEQVLARAPAGRWGQPSDLAGTAIFLASSASDFLTGVALPVDGGYSVQV